MLAQSLKATVGRARMVAFEVHGDEYLLDLEPCSCTLERRRSTRKSHTADMYAWKSQYALVYTSRILNLDLN